MDEFSLIEQFFRPIAIKHQEVILGIGDDAACLQLSANQDLLISTDTLVAEVHFLSTWRPYDMAYRALMTNISDIAAMGATPRWVTLALTLPQLNEQWLASFAQGLHAALAEYNLDLIGGDTTKGPLSITITIMGVTPQGQAIRRRGAKPGDLIFVSGELGGAALAVQSLRELVVSSQDQACLMAKLLRPKPRVDFSLLLRSYATAAIDISDGLSADLNHICKASGVGACLNQDTIPLHPLLRQYLEAQSAMELALTGGDDYELCFTVSKSKHQSFMAALAEQNMACYPIGVIEEQPGLRVKMVDNQYKTITPKGYDHFKE